jgi:hypothetical protein
MHCMIILGICRGLVFGVQCLENELWDNFSLKKQLLRKIIETTGLNSLLCWNRMNGIAGFSKMGRPPYCENNKSFFCRTSSVIAPASVAYGHHSHQILRVGIS